MQGKHDKCLICGYEAIGKELSNHIRKEHGLKSIDYTIQQVYGGVRPTCLLCNEETRYSAWAFKRYCKKHAHLAESEAGRRGGKAEAWNKGKTKKTDNRIMCQSIMMTGSNNPFFGKSHSEDSKKRISDNKKLSFDEFLRRVKEAPGNWKLISTFDGYENRQRTYLDFVCEDCGLVSKRNLYNIERGAACKNCYSGGKSLAEREISDFVESLGFNTERNVRHVISPKELDVWIPEKRVAIEYHGLYWHSRDDKDPNDHLNKWRACQEKGIRLIQFFSDEWRDKREICESIISHALGRTEERVFARNCQVVVCDPTEARDMLERSHIDGATRSKRYFGLRHDGRLISVLSVRTPFHKGKSDMLEIARFASLPGLSVVGGLGKLMKRVREFAREEGYRGVTTFVDLRIGTGRGYEMAGFERISHTGKMYWHTDGKRRFNRFAFRADKSRVMTEKQVCEEAGVSQVYGPGNFKYEIVFFSFTASH